MHDMVNEKWKVARLFMDLSQGLLGDLSDFEVFEVNRIVTDIKWSRDRKSDTRRAISVFLGDLGDLSDFDVFQLAAIVTTLSLHHVPYSLSSFCLTLLPSHANYDHLRSPSNILRVRSTHRLPDIASFLDSSRLSRPNPGS
jgi:hypothetical protein